MKWKCALEPGGDKSLEISYREFWNNIEVRLDGNLIGAIPNKKELETGRIFQLPDGTALKVQLVNNKLRVLRNDKPLLGSSSDPATSIYFIAGFNIVLGFIALIFQVEFLQTLGFGIISVAIGFIFLVLGFFTQRRSLIALIIAMIIYSLEGVSVLFSGFNMLFSAFNAGTSLHLIGEILQSQALLIGCLAGWIYGSIALLIDMGKGVRAINGVKKETPSNVPVINKNPSRGLALGVLVVFIILGVGIYYIYTSQVKKVIDEPSIDERNAAAVAAVTYESGAGFVEALERAGFPCTNPTISPFTASAQGLTAHLADKVSCDYGNGDVVRAFVATPSKVGRDLFSGLFENHMEAESETGAQSLTLKGEFWFAWASDDQELFDIQEALGGQLFKP